MPVIQPYEASDAPSSDVNIQSATPNDMGANVGSAMETTGNDIANNAYKVNEDQGRLWAFNAASQLRQASQAELQQQKEKADPSNPNFSTFASDYAQHFQDQADQVMQAAPSRSAQKYLGLHLATLKDTLYQHAAGFQAQAQAEYGTTLHDEGMDHATQSLTVNPGNDNFNQIRAANESAIDGISGLNYVQKQRLKNDDLRRMSFAQITGAALGNSTGFLKDIGLTGAQVTPRGIAGGVGTGVPGPLPKSNDPYFEQALTSMGLTGPTAGFARAIYAQESGSGAANTTGMNSSNVTGPMQVQQATFDGLKAQGLIPKSADITNPSDNKLAGAALIRQLNAAYGGNQQQMAAAYYAGPKAVNDDGSINRDMRDLKNPNAPTVGQYVDQVTARAGDGTTPTNVPLAAMADADPTPEGTIIGAQSSLEGWDHLTVQQRIQTVRMAEQNIRLQNAGQGAAAAAAAKALKAAQESDMNGMFNKITDPTTPQDITGELRANTRLTFEQRERVVAFQKSYNAGADKTDPSTFNDVFQKIHSGAITNPDQLSPYLGNGIAYNDLTKLRGEIEGKGQPLAAQKAAFFTQARAQISKSSIQNGPDPDGERNYYQFQNDANALIDAKTKAGVPLSDMLDPRNKEYVGAMIPRYQRSMNQTITDMTTRMSAKPLPLAPQLVRQPGESPAAYWARVGNAGGSK